MPGEGGWSETTSSWGSRAHPLAATFLTLERARQWLRRLRGDRETSTDVHPAPPAPTPPADDALHEPLRDATFRIRSRSSEGLGTGAGFAIDSRLIVTNGHVVEGDDPLEVTTWDGRLLEVDVGDVAQDHDLALLKTAGTLNSFLQLASRPARDGELVRIVGYPLGAQFSLIRGLIVGHVDGRPFEDGSHVLRVKAVVLPGYSGGPIVDAYGHVVGVVYAQGRATRHALAIPVSSLTRWLANAGYRPS